MTELNKYERSLLRESVSTEQNVIDIFLIRVKELEAENINLRKYYRDFEIAVVKITAQFSEHPEGYDWPCNCHECQTA